MQYSSCFGGMGEEYAGLFSNNDDLSNNIFKSSEEVNEKVSNEVIKLFHFINLLDR